MRNGRSGASAIEFALLMPVFVLVLAGLMEFSWLFFMDAGLQAAIREGCRAGALTDPLATPGPEQVTETTVDTWLSRYGVSCVGSGARCAVATQEEEEGGEVLLRCEATLQYQSLTGLVPAPDQLRAIAVLRQEGQE